MPCKYAIVAVECSAFFKVRYEFLTILRAGCIYIHCFIFLSFYMTPHPPGAMALCLYIQYKYYVYIMTRENVEFNYYNMLRTVCVMIKTKYYINIIMYQRIIPKHLIFHILYY